MSLTATVPLQHCPTDQSDSRFVLAQLCRRACPELAKPNPSPQTVFLLRVGSGNETTIELLHMMSSPIETNTKFTSAWQDRLVVQILKPQSQLI